ncbi:zinc-ribbon and DUF3426 domain-containing protein [Variovorax paradoxus]|uniref:zinc-ribbon and DUF3426 domain-containing protein n=1 Tax=Variovorax paradoxus TaxID=34073 RepID=UPI003D65A81E
MSLVTRCPACATTFKVVRDQLRISDGWVRCGRCSNVFDATLDLHEAPDGVPGPAAPPPPPQPPAEPEAQPGPSGQNSTPAAHAASESSSVTDDADFFDDDSEHQESLDDDAGSTPPSEAIELLPPAELPATRPASAPPSASASATGSTEAPATAFVLPAHGIVADELWSDFEANEPEWRPPASSLPPFPNIDLNLAAPPSPPPPPPPPLPALRIKAREMAASASVEDEKHEAAQDRDQVQMQKALRRARIKSAKIASAKARDERSAAKAAGSMVREASELDGDSSPLPLPAPLHEADDSDRVPFSGDETSANRDAPGFWQRGPVRFALWFLAALAALLFVVQVLHHERDGIVARQPNLRPAFAAMCRLAGCELTALRQIGDIVIEGAAFAREKTGNNDYRLSFTLRNGAMVPLAMPAIELSLLDTQERAVVRRVLTASDYGAPAVLAARSDQAASLPLTLSATESAALPPIAGYRVEAFYP